MMYNRLTSVGDITSGIRCTRKYSDFLHHPLQTLKLNLAVVTPEKQNYF